MEEKIAIASEANKSINELSEMIEQVADFINVITTIADITNLFIYTIVLISQSLLYKLVTKVIPCQCQIQASQPLLSPEYT